MEAIDINNTFGAMLIGALVTMTYFYFTTYPQDSPRIKYFVGLIWGLDTVHVVFMCHTMHHYLIAGFGDPAYLVEGTWSLFSSIMINVIISFLVQCFFALRIHGLCPKPYKWWITSVIGSMVFAHLCFGIGEITVVSDHFSANNRWIWQKLFVRKEFSRLNEVNYVAVLPFAITAILSDLLIALGLCFLLRRSRTNFANTDYIIKILVRYAITRCLLTSLMAVVETILATSFHSFAIDFVIGKIWSNSLLASLNSRRSLRDTFNRKNSGSVRKFPSSSKFLGKAKAEAPMKKVVTPPLEISTQASRQSSEVRFSVVDTIQQTK
ncbi:hypothetical protein EV421DRAFT_1899708 [Armillaria borealis]|uniref:DUF6534 domain-containing protein n=1 Tax=Armillaria borealis TaxID=47425 RepID=A0AA39JYM0_9AGAR|nr:hypothetical protein EV421DRAFT_1899708 [Armillaria borealis]